MRNNIICLYKHILQINGIKNVPLIRCMSTQEAKEKRHHLFTLEKKRQIEKVGRIEKIEVKYEGVPNDCTLIMNKELSTPHDCAKHLSEWHADSSALALVNGTLYWDMHRPLTESCTLKLLNYTTSEPQQVNKAFWRSCSLVLGACASVAFKEHVPVRLHSFPGPDVRSGSFIYDVELPTLEEWKPTHQELLTLSAEFIKICRQNLPLERLEVSQDLALEMFSENPHKSKQIPSIARANGKVTLYRMGKHVDISKGPMINHSGQIGRVAVSSVHRIQGAAQSEVKQLYRLQAVALPAGVVLNHFAFTLLTDRAKRLNPARSPIASLEEDSHLPESVAAKA